MNGVILQWLSWCGYMSIECFVDGPQSVVVAGAVLSIVLQSFAEDE